MPYFLDGNNLIGLARRTSRPAEEDRAALLAEVSERLRGRRASVRIFFDGPAGKTLTLGGLSVKDAGGSADEAILREVRAARDPGEISVVTADRELTRRARAAGAKTLSPPEFWERFRAVAAGAPAPGKPERVDVSEWLDYFADPRNRE
ncbi:MAG: NYN domain-containing protein [Acidobacteriota bacterium]